MVADFISTVDCVQTEVVVIGPGRAPATATETDAFVLVITQNLYSGTTISEIGAMTPDVIRVNDSSSTVLQGTAEVMNLDTGESRTLIFDIQWTGAGEIATGSVMTPSGQNLIHGITATSATMNQIQS